LEETLVKISFLPGWRIKMTKQAEILSQILTPYFFQSFFFQISYFFFIFLLVFLGEFSKTGVGW